MQDAGANAAARFHPLTVEHFQHPRNVGRMVDADRVGRVDDPDTDTTIMLYLKLAGSTVERATFRALACSACIAACSVTTEWLTGRTENEAAALDAPTLDALLGCLPPDKRYCLNLVLQAVARVLGR